MRTATRRLLLFGGAVKGVKDPDARAYGAAVGLPSTDPRLALIETLIVALKTAGVWTLLDRLWLFAAQNSTQALTDLVARATATAVNSPTLTIDQGYAGNATTSYLNSNFNPVAAAGKLTLNSAHLGAYVRTNRTTGTDKTIIGGFVSSNDIEVYPFRVSGRLDFRVNSSALSAGPTVSTALGHSIANRSGASAVGGSRNGAALTATTEASTGLPNTNLNIGADTAGGSPSDDQIAIAHWGASLSNTQIAAIASACNAYMTSLGTNVY